MISKIMLYSTHRLPDVFACAVRAPSACLRGEVIGAPVTVGGTRKSTVPAEPTICGSDAFVIDDDRRWLKARYGLPPEVIEAPRAVTVCSTWCRTLGQDPRFKDSPNGSGKSALPILLRHAAHH